MDSGTRNLLLVFGGIVILSFFKSSWALAIAGALLVVFLLAGIKKHGISPSSLGGLTYA